MKKITFILLVCFLNSCGPSDEEKRNIEPLLGKLLSREELFFQIQFPKDPIEKQKWLGYAKERLQGKRKEETINYIHKFCSDELENLGEYLDCQIKEYNNLITTDADKARDSLAAAEQTCAKIVLSTNCKKEILEHH